MARTVVALAEAWRQWQRGLGGRERGAATAVRTRRERDGDRTRAGDVVASDMALVQAVSGEEESTESREEGGREGFACGRGEKGEKKRRKRKEK